MSGTVFGYSMSSVFAAQQGKGRLEIGLSPLVQDKPALPTPSLRPEVPSLFTEGQEVTARFRLPAGKGWEEHTGKIVKVDPTTTGNFRLVVMREDGEMVRAYTGDKNWQLSVRVVGVECAENQNSPVVREGGLGL